jgi:hypothetical protein
MVLEGGEIPTEFGWAVGRRGQLEEIVVDGRILLKFHGIGWKGCVLN